MKLLLIRHGQTDSNKAGALDTAMPGAPLNETGNQQAQNLKAAMCRGELPKPTKIAASPILRARQTAQPLASECGLEVIVHDGLREIIAGDLEMNTDVESIQTYLKTVGYWLAGKTQQRMPGAENGEEVFRRFDGAVRELAAGLGDDDTLAIVAHGAVIRYFCASVAPQVSIELVAQHPVPNTSWALLEGEVGSWRCLNWASQPVESWPITKMPSNLSVEEAIETAFQIKPSARD